MEFKEINYMLSCLLHANIFLIPDITVLINDAKKFRTHLQLNIFDSLIFIVTYIYVGLNWEIVNTKMSTNEKLSPGHHNKININFTLLTLL